MDFFALGANDGGGLDAGGGGFGVFGFAVGGAVGDAAALGGELVAVEAVGVGAGAGGFVQ